MNNTIAKAAYVAYGKSTDNKNYQGLPMPEWKDLPPAIQTAWIAASGEALKSWFDTEMRAAITDKDFFELELGILKVGRDKGDEPTKVLKIAVASFIGKIAGYDFEKTH